MSAHRPSNPFNPPRPFCASRARARLAGLLVVLAGWASGCGGETEREARTDPAPAIAAASGLIPRDVLFGGPDRIRGRLSPDGSKASWIAVSGDGSRLFVGPADDPESARAVSPPTARVLSYDWAKNNTHVLVVHTDPTGRYALDAIDVSTARTVPLSPDGAVASAVAATSWDHPDDAIVSMGPLIGAPDRYARVNLVTGETSSVLENAEAFDSVVFDADLEARIAQRADAEGGVELFSRRAGGAWTALARIAPEESDGFKVLGLDASGDGLILIDGRGRASTALVRLDLLTRDAATLGAVDGADVVDVLTHPVTGEPDAFAVSRVRKEWIPLNVRAAEAFHALDKATEGELSVLARTVDDRFWIAFDETASNPGRYFVFDRETGDMSPMLDIQPALAAADPIVTTPIVIKARDGLDLVSHLTLPAGADIDGDGAPDRPSPLIIAVPRAPGDRVGSGYDAHARWAADRGYAYLRVSVRGSGGLGQAMLAAGDGEWGAKVLDDVDDVIAWALARGVTEAGRVAVMGDALGGSVAFASLARSPERVACAAGWGAPVDLAAFAADPPPGWSAAALRRHVGDPDDPTLRARLDSARLDRHETVAGALLALYPSSESGRQADAGRAWIERLIANGVAATYVGYDVDEQKITDPAIGVGVNAMIEAFISGCLGGASQPIADDLDSAPINDVLGADAIPGLPEALAERRLASSATD